MSCVHLVQDSRFKIQDLYSMRGLMVQHKSLNESRSRVNYSVLNPKRNTDIELGTSLLDGGLFKTPFFVSLINKDTRF